MSAESRTPSVRHKPVHRLRKSEWMVDAIDMQQAIEIVARLHYANGSANTAVFRHGLFRRSEFPFFVMGAAMWMPPTRPAAEATVAVTGGDWHKVLALSRLVIEPEVPTNGASFLLSRSTKLIAADGRWDVLVTYAHEWQGHTGTIYRAAGWEYLGETKPERTYVLNGVQKARKHGKDAWTHDEMIAMGAECLGPFIKHKFVKVLR